MKIVIPMSGFGERFKRAGYKVPKPLIEVESMGVATSGPNVSFIVLAILSACEKSA